MGACQIIKANDTMCKNYARKGMSCCWPHRSLENTVYVEDQERIVRDFVCDIFKKIEGDWPLSRAIRLINVALHQEHALVIVGYFLAESETSDLFDKRHALLVAAEYFLKYPVDFNERTLGNTIIRKLIEAECPYKNYINKLIAIINK